LVFQLSCSVTYLTHLKVFQHRPWM
jgi:hypothetical protein